MNKTLLLAASALVIAGCGNTGTKLSQAEIEEYGEIGYADIVSFIVQGYQSRWAEMNPEEQGLSSVYHYCSPTAGAAIQDINGDGIKELLIGDKAGSTVRLYDIFTINPKDASLIHLAKGGERDTFTINSSGTIIENGSNSAFDSFTKAYAIKDGKLEEIKDNAFEESLMKIELDNFAILASPAHEVCGGFTDQREMDEVEMAMFRKATENEGHIVYTPLSVSTQVVAGINYMFWCRFEDTSDEMPEEEIKPGDRYGYCWVKIFKPLPGCGDPSVTNIEKVNY